MKEMIWRILVFFASLVPESLRRQFCRVMMAAESRLDDTAQASVNLLRLGEDINWYINAAALRYGNGIHPKHRLTNYHEYFVNRIKKGEKVLDVGCGYGALANELAQSGAVVTGIDIKEENITKARRKFSHEMLTFRIGDITSDSLTDDIDTVVLSNVLEHIENRIDLLKRLSVPPGAKRFLIRVPMINRDWKVFFKKELGMPYFGDPEHFTEYTVNSFFIEMQQAELMINSYEIMWGELYSEVLPSP